MLASDRIQKQTKGAESAKMGLQLLLVEYEFFRVSSKSLMQNWTS
jgi:hypothetical protein